VANKADREGLPCLDPESGHTVDNDRMAGGRLQLLGLIHTKGLSRLDRGGLPFKALLICHEAQLVSLSNWLCFPA
jgi:hypothetical protein